jgi:hypothetical protein
MTKHFFKTLITFGVILAVGFIGYIVLIGMEEGGSQPSTAKVSK